MSLNDPSPATISTGFPVTRWSLICEAQGKDEIAARAMNDLCALYWPPVDAFVRRKGKSPQDAEDITQGFFSDLLCRGSLDSVAEEKGRLQPFLLKAVSRHMLNEYEKSSAANRGGGAATLSLDFAIAESGYIAEPGHSITPELEFERQWAISLFDRALADT